MSEYKPVPVEAAKAIAETYDKSMVVICCWDEKANKLHTTTYGVSPKDKHMAAIGGEMAARVLGGDLSKKEDFEDYRKNFNAEKYATLREQILQFMPALKDCVAHDDAGHFFKRLVETLERGL